MEPAGVQMCCQGARIDGSIDPAVIAIHTYDWLDLGPHDKLRIERAERTRTENLRASLDRLAALAERHAPQR